MASQPNILVFPTLASGSEPPQLPEKKRRRRREGGPPFLQFEEVARFFKAIDKTAPACRRARDRAIFRLVYHAGMRASEPRLLDLRDYNPQADRIYIHRLKGSNSGDHPMMREEARAFHAWLKIRGNGPGCVFPSRLGSGISRDQLDELMKQYSEAAGLPKELRHMHVWKHTCCTHLRMMGMAVEDIQDWVGHVNIQSSMVYSHSTSERRDELARGLAGKWK
jgi:integrase